MRRVTGRPAIFKIGLTQTSEQTAGKLNVSTRASMVAALTGNGRLGVR
jgi:hypothetical protein